MKALHFIPGNARFWEFVNLQWVRITLRPGQSLTWHKSYFNGEGWSWESIRWAYDGRTVIRSCAEGGRDCDGPSSSSYEQSCMVIDLARVGVQSNYNAPGVLRPAWGDFEHEEQRDAYAEAMGY